MTPETQHVVSLMAKASGETVEDITGKGRRRPLPCLRWLIGRELMDRGYDMTYAARQLGIDRVTLLHGLREIKRMGIDKRWAPEVTIAGEFRALLDSETV